MRIWDAKTRREARNSRGPESDPFVHLAYSPGSDMLVSWGAAIRLWQMGSVAKPLRAFGEQAGLRIAAVAWSPDGRLLASGSSGATTGDDVVHVWEAASGTERFQLAGHRYAISATAFAPDGATLVSASRDGTALLWDLKALVQVLPDPGDLQVDGREGYWADLADSDAARAFRAMRAFIRSPRRALPLLKERLQPLVLASRKQLERWLEALDSGIFKEREDASEALALQAELADATLRVALMAKRPPESHRRLQQIVQQAKGGFLSPSLLRKLRSVEILESIGTPEARQVLEKMAAGTPEFLVTREAKAALARLAQDVKKPTDCCPWDWGAGYRVTGRRSSSNEAVSDTR